MPPKRRSQAPPPWVPTKPAAASGDDAAPVQLDDAETRDATSLPPDLECGICRDLLDGATQTPCCGGLSCRSCIEKSAASSSACPYCREALLAANVHTDVRLERAAAGFIRPCKYDGCDYRGKRDELKAHTAACDRRPKDEIIAELRGVKRELTGELERWVQQRCWQLSLVRSQVRVAKAWTIQSIQHLELMCCRVHLFEAVKPTGAYSRTHESDTHAPCAPELSQGLLPRTRAELHGFAFNQAPAVGVAPVIKLSHIEDQDKPTTCYIINSYKPGSARRITIPAKATDAILIKDLLTEEQGRGPVNVYLAKTLGDFGLGPDGNYADPRVAQKY